MKRHLGWTLASLGWLGPVGAVALPAQETPAALPGVFSEVLDVRVVNLEVVVTDKQGVPVVGLRPEDFVLTVDDETVPIEYFSEIRRGVAVAPASAEAAAVAELPAVVAGEPIETSYLVFIDEYFGFARDRDRVLDALIADLPFLAPGDRMALVAYNGRQLEMLSSWSQSGAALERALERAKQRPTFGLRRLAEQRQFDFDEILEATSRIRLGTVDVDRFLRTDLNPNERFYVERLTDQVQQAVTAAASTLRSFAMPPGRKVMLLYAGGWPYFPVSFLGSNYSPIVLPFDVESGPGLFRPLTDTANLLGYTIYAIDMPGFHDLLADVSGRPGGAEFIGGPSGLVGRSSTLRQQEVRYTLEFLASETGGRALIDAQRLRAFDEVVSDTRSFYWLGFTPERGWDDQRHRVVVTVREAGFRVRSRSGFLDSSKQHEVSMALESALLFGSPPAAGESLRVELGTPKRTGRRRMQVPLTVLIPLSEVTFLPDGEAQVAQLELRVAVRDEQGRRAAIPILPMVIRSGSESAGAEIGRYQTALKLRPLRHDAVIAVYDPLSGRILSTSVEIAP